MINELTKGPKRKQIKEPTRKQNSLKDQQFDKIGYFAAENVLRSCALTVYLTVTAGA